jgi:asparagine synthase (glutamine-hydrolysing)
MCGLCGFFVPGGARFPDDLLPRMTESLAHRGPDGDGHWSDAAAGVGLGHRRLSILDLSPLGAQPMRSKSGRFELVFNGEIYNFASLARELVALGHTLRAQGDTEVILAAFEQWGVAEATKRFNGIFAYALWDRQQVVLHLGRDHLGVKPLYYGWVGKALVFGSELAPITKFPGFTGAINRDAITLLLRHNCIPAPYSIYEGVKKLAPATILTIGESTGGERLNAYWSARQAFEAGQRQPFAGTDTEAVDALDTLLRAAVKSQMVSDVPLGAFLSGGIDSSTVVALMQAQNASPVRTFSIGFTEESFNEATYARRVSQHLSTNHTELYVTPEVARTVIPNLPRHYDEPFSDSSQIPTLLVSELARRSVTVCLSGDGGDELFAGYNRHVLGEQIWRRLRYLPQSARRLMAAAIRAISPSTLDRVVAGSGLLRSRQISQARIGGNLHKLAGLLDASGPDDIYRRLVSHWQDPKAVVLGAREPQTHITNRSDWPVAGTFTEHMAFLDLMTYLPDDILVKLDRASMAVGLEARVPLLDVRLVEFAYQLPLQLKLRNGVGKWVLREVLARYVPPTMFERPKSGFGLPLGQWLRGPLREWAEDLLSESQLRSDGYFKPAPIRRFWNEHQTGEADRQYELWDVLMFQAWLHDPNRRSV